MDDVDTTPAATLTLAQVLAPPPAPNHVELARSLAEGASLLAKLRESVAQQPAEEEEGADERAAMRRRRPRCSSRSPMPLRATEAAPRSRSTARRAAPSRAWSCSSSCRVDERISR